MYIHLLNIIVFLLTVSWRKNGVPPGIYLIMYVSMLKTHKILFLGASIILALKMLANCRSNCMQSSCYITMYSFYARIPAYGLASNNFSCSNHLSTNRLWPKFPERQASNDVHINVCLSIYLFLRGRLYGLDIAKTAYKNSGRPLMLGSSWTKRNFQITKEWFRQIRPKWFTKCPCEQQKRKENNISHRRSKKYSFIETSFVNTNICASCFPA